ncbi:hypothetical protein V8G54_000067 (mitochondrion) [Vigna mungo]|uniref:Uncharacterized protein n=1 Tax=Vigna mungo TaxID=3915 RepID=A0AAQ3SC34_VIGMU
MKMSSCRKEKNEETLSGIRVRGVASSKSLCSGTVLFSPDTLPTPRFDIGLITDVESEAKTALLPFLIHPLPQLQAITLFRALASNPDIRSIDICRAGKKAVWSRNPVTEGFR